MAIPISSGRERIPDDASVATWLTVKPSGAMIVPGGRGEGSQDVGSEIVSPVDVSTRVSVGDAAPITLARGVRVGDDDILCRK